VSKSRLLEPKQRGRSVIKLLRYVIAWAIFFGLVVFSTPVLALELSNGVSLGGVQIGTAPRLAVSPTMSVLWRIDGGLIFALHDLFNILPPINKSGIGVYNHTSAALGYAWENGLLDIGPSFSIYSTPACGAKLCGRVAGLSPGGQVQASLYFTGPLGASVSVNVDWVGGNSRILPGGVAAMVVAGPVFRWNVK
jgi:hypothetical protein